MGVCGSSSSVKKAVPEQDACQNNSPSLGGFDYPTAHGSVLGSGSSTTQEQQGLAQAKRAADTLLATVQARLETANLLLKAREDEVKILQEMLKKPNRIGEELDPDSVNIRVDSPANSDHQATAMLYNMPIDLQDIIEKEKARLVEGYKMQLKDLRDAQAQEMAKIVTPLENNRYEGQFSSLNTVIQTTVSEIKARVQQQHQAERDLLEAQFKQGLAEAESKALSMVLEVASSAVATK